MPIRFSTGTTDPMFTPSLMAERVASFKKQTGLDLSLRIFKGPHSLSDPGAPFPPFLQPRLSLSVMFCLIVRKRLLMAAVGGCNQICNELLNISLGRHFPGGEVVLFLQRCMTRPVDGVSGER